MKELTEYRRQLIAKLESSAHDFCAACLAVKDPFAALAGDGWSVHQIASHLRDADQLAYGERARRTILEDNPTFQNFDGEAYAREHHSPDEALQNILDEFVKNVETLAELLRAQPAEAWARESKHEKFGSGLTLQLWVERGLAHIEEHLETVKKA